MVNASPLNNDFISCLILLRAPAKKRAKMWRNGMKFSWQNKKQEKKFLLLFMAFSQFLLNNGSWRRKESDGKKVEQAFSQQGIRIKYARHDGETILQTKFIIFPLSIALRFLSCSRCHARN
jgi:hypothetical protein